MSENKINENKKENLVYLKVYKDFTKQMDSKFEGRKIFNVMHLPKGVKVGDMDLSGGIINPLIMYQDKYNKNMMVAQYDKNYLKDNSIVVNKKVDEGFEKIKVDIDILQDEVMRVNKEYIQNKKLAEKEIEDKEVEHEEKYEIKEEKIIEKQVEEEHTF